MDKLGHFALCLLVALWRPDWAVVVALTIEATQFEAYWRRWWRASGRWWKPFTTYWWGDTVLDLLADALGIAAAAIIRTMLWS